MNISLLSFDLKFSGIVGSDVLVEPTVAANNQLQSKQRHFSFPLTSHLHDPAFRLVSLHPSLEVVLSFLRVPEIHDGFEYKVFVSRSTSVEDVISRVLEELGLIKSFPIPGAGNPDYILEEVWFDGHNECMFQLFHFLQWFDIVVDVSQLVPTTRISSIIAFPFSVNPSKSTAKRYLRFCVPDEWYRRSKSRSVLPAPGPSESTLRRLAGLAVLQESESEEDAESESTAKLRTRNPTADAKQRGLVTQVRLSSMFGEWLRPSSPTTSRNSAVKTDENRKSVSEPKPAPVSRLIERTDSSDLSEDEQDGDFDEAFEKMMVNCTPTCLRSSSDKGG